jgi:hypothetical protein
MPNLLFNLVLGIQLQGSLHAQQALSNHWGGLNHHY